MWVRFPFLMGGFWERYTSGSWQTISGEIYTRNTVFGKQSWEMSCQSIKRHYQILFKIFSTMHRLSSLRAADNMFAGHIHLRLLLYRKLISICIFHCSFCCPVEYQFNSRLLQASESSGRWRVESRVIRSESTVEDPLQQRSRCDPDPLSERSAEEVYHLRQSTSKQHPAISNSRSVVPVLRVENTWRF